MRVTRTQYPVGQGCFLAGCLEWAGKDGLPRTFRYIYDCGSTTGVDSLQDPIMEIASQGKRVDALFVSHLHRDHVNGIDRLFELGNIEVGTVFVPHVGIGATIADLLAAKFDGTLSGALVEARLRPDLWFGRKGVRQVVRVLAAQGGEAPGDGAAGIPPDDEEPDAAKFVLDAGAGFEGPFRSPAASTTMDSGTVISPAAIPVDIDWDLVPHVDPLPPGARLDEFERDVRYVMELGDQQRVTPNRLLEALKCPSRIADLKRCYRFLCYGGGATRHNRASMSLYSGPAADRGSDWDYQATAQMAREAWATRIRKGGGRSRAGWLGTGDSDLANARIRREWENTYRPYRDLVYTFLLPQHGLPQHGSDRKLDAGLLDLTGASVVVTTARDGSAKHPGEIVDRTLDQGNRILHRVTEIPESVFSEELGRTYD